MSSVVFSIVTVVRNARADLQVTLESLRQQTYPYLEYIVIDGASTDGTLDIIKNNLDIITKWQSERDNGIYDAMNKGKKLATGDFVIFINAGDVFSSPTVFDDFYKNMSSDKTLLSYGKTLLVNKDVAWEYMPADNKNMDNYIPHHQAVFYPAIFYKTEDYDTNFRIIGDVDYSLRAIRRLNKQYIPLNIVKSEVTGFSVEVYSSIKSIRLYIKDHQHFVKKHPHLYSALGNLNVYGKAIIKYFAYKIGGAYLINKMLAARVQVMGASYKG